MASSNSANPKIVFAGMNDISRRAVDPTEETTPQHYPLIRIWAQTGPDDLTIPTTETSDLSRIFGENTLATRGVYFNHQSLLARIMLSRANGIMVKRMVPEDAPAPARIILGIDIVKDQIPDPTDPKSVDSDPNTARISGYRARIVTIKDNTTEVGRQKVIAGNILAKADGSQSKIYPLLELPTSFIGADGNLTGLRLWAPSNLDTIAPDLDTAEKFKTRMLRAQFVKRPTETTSPQVISTVDSETYVDFCLTEGAYSESTDVEYYGPDVLVQRYQDSGDDTGTSPIFSPFEKLHVYHDNLLEVQKMVQEAILANQPTLANELTSPDTVNIWTATDLDENAYKGLLLEGPIYGGLNLGKESTIYASGGGDGTINNANFEKAIVAHNRAIVSGSNDEDYSLVAKYPFSVIYDSGFSVETKNTLIPLLGVRPDIRVVLTTMVAGEVPLTISQELSRGTALFNRIAAFPESTLYGTPVCRGEIIYQSGKLVGSDYRKQVPLLVDYADSFAEMAGAGTGIMRTNKYMDEAPNNFVSLVRGLNVDSFPSSVSERIWGVGGTYAQAYDRRRHYYPALHSVYNDDTSVLTSPITVHIACDVIRQVIKTHAYLSGNSSLTDAQFIERSNTLVGKAVSGRYGERIRTVVNTRLTDADKKRGFSWTTDVTIYANNERNVMQFNLMTERMSEYPSA